MNKRIEIQYQRNFDTLLFDSIEMLFRSLDRETDFDFGQTLARSSMINSILMLELVANICIETLDLERSVFNEIDKFSVLGKFDYFLRVSFRNKKIDRGIKEVEGITELKRLRDGYVHMKPHKIEMEIIGDSGSGQFETTNLLGIPKNPQGWDQTSAISVMAAVHDFLKYFFKEKCKYSAYKVSSLLFSEAKIPGSEGVGIPLLYKTTRTELKNLGIDISYFKVMWV